jgi:magnesium transporter
MKFLAVVTIVLSVPSLIFSAYGMNVNVGGMPFASSPYGFAMIILISIVMSIVVSLYFSKKNMY